MATEFAIRSPEELQGLLQAFRKDAGLTQTEVAARMGLTQQKLSHLERYAQNASTERLLPLLSVLGVEMVLRRRDQAGSAAPPPFEQPW